ncbi:hypothetical protein PHET_09396 [Paragonimus heterotremus]|uniref:RING-type domain-containing protein n=1 Tax=Paragonimus heterotremus TaxID=100268 RepID=A0A8J4T4P8_9TREM|nr:hypothetical protein PHET_09396 [Paragonimus heterotremus]
MDAQVSRVFIPCGHIICCAECANRIELCSVCRKPIEIRHPCFLPWDPELENHMQLESHRVRRQSARSISNSSASGTFLLHTVSAPTCNLFSLPSTHCLEPVNDHAVSSSNPDASDCEILTDMNSQWATDKEEHNNFERPSSSQSDQSAAHESVTADARSSVSPSPSLANSLPLTSEHSSTLPMNTVITTADSGGGSSEIGSTATTVANSSRRSAHVTWQITN